MAYEYIRRVHYHETDKMGITHHSNYIKWMEEARIAFLSSIGCPYSKMEEAGILSPVIGVECRYQHPTTFDDVVKIHVSVAEFKGVKLVIGYEMTHAETGKTVLTGRTMHCFTTPEGKPIILKKQHPELDGLLKTMAAQ